MFRPFFGNLIEPGGDPASGALINTYVKGTNTRVAMYTDSAGTIPATNPVVADSDGRFRVYFNDALNYTVSATPSDGTPTILEADITAGVLTVSLVYGAVWHTDWTQPLSEPLEWTDVASATTTDLSAADANNIRITGTTTITAFGTAISGLRRMLRFAAALTLTHNGTSLILPGAANITTAADDTAEFASLGSGNWICVSYKRAANSPVAYGTGIATALTTNVGSAGAPVINGGALGTPSSGTLTNATGLPVSTGLAGLGAGVAALLAQDADEWMDDAKGVRVVNTYADMTSQAADRLVAGGVFYVRGKATANDGAAGLFEVVAGTALSANGGTILTHDSLSFQFRRLFDGPVSLQWWNGITQDIAVALQAAIDYCETATTGEILIPYPIYGYWNLSQRVEMSGNAPITIRGVGQPIIFVTGSVNGFHAGVLTGLIGLIPATLAIGSTPQNVASSEFSYLIDGETYTKTAVAAGTALGSDVVPIGKYGAVALDINAAGTISTASAPANATGYNSAALAAAALPAVASGKVRMGYVTASKSDGAFTFGTTALNASNTTVAYTSSSSQQARAGHIVFKDLGIYSDGANGQIGIRGAGLTNIFVDNCDVFRFVEGNIYYSDCYTFVLRDVGVVHDSFATTGNYGSKFDGASFNNARVEGGHHIGFLKTGSKAMIVKGGGFGFHLSMTDFESNLVDVSVQADSTGCVDGLHAVGVYVEDPYGIGRTFIEVANGIAIAPKNITMRNCNLLNEHVLIYACNGFTEDSNIYHGSPAGATTANEVLYLGSSVTNWRLGNSRYINAAFGTTPDKRNFLERPAWIAYTPTWTAASSNPSLGNGTISGYYTRIGDTVFVRIRLVMGSTTTFGTGRWEFSLPFNARSDVAWEYLKQDTHYFENGAGAFAGVIATIIYHSDPGKVKLIRASDFNDVNASVPIIWATDDQLHVSFHYDV